MFSCEVDSGVSNSAPVVSHTLLAPGPPLVQARRVHAACDSPSRLHKREEAACGWERRAWADTGTYCGHWGLMES